MDGAVHTIPIGILTTRIERKYFKCFKACFNAQQVLFSVSTVVVIDANLLDIDASLSSTSVAVAGLFR
jgi:hypothetical protein